MKKIVLVLAVALLLVSSVVWADNGSESKAVRNRFTANANAWSPELTGHIKVGRVAVGNVGMIDFEDDTNIDDDDVYGITFRYELTKRTTLEFSYDGLD